MTRLILALPPRLLRESAGEKGTTNDLNRRFPPFRSSVRRD